MNKDLNVLGLEAVSFQKRVDSKKLISRSDQAVSVIPAVLITINNMSALRENDGTFQNIPLQDWPVPEFLADLVLPSKVSLNASQKEEDYLVHPEVIDGQLSLNDWKDAIDVISLCLSKRDVGTRFKTLETLKHPMLLSNVKNFCVGDNNDFCANDIDYAYPLNIKLLKDQYMTSVTKDVADLTLLRVIESYKNQ